MPPRPKSLTHLLSTDSLSDSQLHALLNEARAIRKKSSTSPDKKSRPKNSGLLITLFYESSTRTRSSFELAAKRAGLDVLSLNVAHSSVQKGETLLDTIATLDAYDPDFIAIRHPMSGAAELAAQATRAHVLNAGDGCHEHPTQALADLLTILDYTKTVKGLRVSIIGDIAHSRVAHSNIALLSRLGAKITLVAPPMMLHHYDSSIRVTHALEDGLRDADVVMALRLQHERFQGPYFGSVREFSALYGLDAERLRVAKRDVIVLHPGPVNRDVEIKSALINSPVCKMREQVKNGLAIRQAILSLLAKER